MTKLIALDIDGTLVNNEGNLDSITIKTIKEKTKQGFKFIVCTGRPFAGVKNVISQLGLDGKDDFVISNNGALIQNSFSEEVLYRKSLPFEDFQKIEELSYHLKIPFHIQSDDGIYTTNKNIGEYSVYDSVLNKVPIFYRESNELSSIPINKMMFVDNPDNLDRVIQLIPLEYYTKYNLMKSLDFFFEFLNIQANKGKALKYLSDKLNIKKEDVIAIGDNDNDISMLSFAGVGVSMENGSEQAKAIADFMTLSNEDNGVAYFLEKHL